MTRARLFHCCQPSEEIEEEKTAAQLLTMLRANMNKKSGAIAYRYLMLFFSGVMLLGFFGLDAYLVSEVIREKSEADARNDHAPITSSNYSLEIAFPMTAFAMLAFIWFVSDMLSIACRKKFSNKILGCTLSLPYRNIPTILSEMSELTLNDLNLPEKDLKNILDFGGDQFTIHMPVLQIMNTLKNMPREDTLLLKNSV